MNDVVISGSSATEWLKKKNYPFSDLLQLERSTHSFDDGGQYGKAIAFVNG